MRFVCDKCGPVQPSKVFYSCPAQADCPSCGQRLTEVDGGMLVRSTYATLEALAKRDAQIVATRQAIEKYESSLEGLHKIKAFQTLLSDLERILEEK